jgi:NAD-dependent protein deacetylase/lipoamidase
VDTAEGIALIADQIAKGGKNVVFTGAGISTESGIPDFRGKGGIWDRFQPVYFDEFMRSREARIEYWRQKTELYHDLMKAAPNPAHMAVARLHEMGLVEAVITQNIDGLHQASGIPEEKVIELHGSNRRVRCMRCGGISSIEEAHRRIEAGDPAPECGCGGYLKPDTISFGQAMPEKEVERAVDLARDCDFFLVVGSTLLVHPAAYMPSYAKEAGAFLAIINLSETPCDGISDVLIRGKAGEVLPKIAENVSQIKILSKRFKVSPAVFI